MGQNLLVFDEGHLFFVSSFLLKKSTLDKWYSGEFLIFLNLDDSSKGWDDVNVDASIDRVKRYPSGPYEFWKDIGYEINEV